MSRLLASAISRRLRAAEIAALIARRGSEIDA
jgi:hypothetical protein